MRRSVSSTTKFLLCAILCCSFFSLSCSNSAAESARTNAAQGKRAPDFTLKDLNGNSVSLMDFYGKKSVLLVCTTTWCPHCVTNIPDLKNIYNRYSNKGLEVLAMYVNEPENKVRTFSQKYDLPYTILLDIDGEAATTYKIRGVPTLMLIDKDGIIKYRGYNVTMDMIDKITQ